ncbi:unnamed protein product [Paramecium primaurelia]|uniref:Transmembrane protein n=1 Tax=Paramecium primaurelia TaxID=5886 RepID=A0A8S1M016_PARPR|nr:unnamed protein product [Paramecium primaurelia]
MKEEDFQLLLISLYLLVKFMHFIGILYLENFNQENWRLMMCLSSTTLLIQRVQILLKKQFIKIKIIQEQQVSYLRLYNQKYHQIYLKDQNMDIFQLKREQQQKNGQLMFFIFKKWNTDRIIQQKQQKYNDQIMNDMMYYGQLLILPFILGSKQKTFVDYLATVLGEIPSIILSLLIVEIPFLGRKNTIAISFFCATIMHVWSYYSSWSYFFFLLNVGLCFILFLLKYFIHLIELWDLVVVLQLEGCVLPFLLIFQYHYLSKKFIYPFWHLLQVLLFLHYLHSHYLMIQLVNHQILESSDGVVESNKEDEIKEIMMVLIEKKIRTEIKFIFIYYQMDPNAQINERYTKLQEKLGALQFEVDNTKDAKIDEIYDRINKAQSELKDIINNYSEQLVLNYVKNRDNCQVNSKILQNNLKNVQELLQQIGQEIKVRNQQVNIINTTLQNDLPQLWQYNVQENQERVQEDQYIVKKASQEISKLFEQANQGKQQREDAEVGIFTMLKEVVIRVKSELEEERQLRMDGHEALLSILEEAYEKMEETHAKVQQQKAALQESK